ncbi:aminotransferase class I/II-fold pyridoxal phosphate-dependent enzyme [Ligilactobacillus saerimneri]|uniref:aminotransferase class I/II-fold pyridoxal phosphate-dependent enzyme n=1 Tax=Ligilactobacillus saerimneri TaxID=228229 RepID=UPI001C1272B0|nr:aminotransferase class I/II-fold pyridoxal phosphate-dependent enzyme [Ligilactobacillus saerimneri]MBU5309126.1 aminotransferase class I/II-fold pyridoxal phosphate-dependent enzyme [Ligilactobacillus saerimneri]
MAGSKNYNKTIEKIAVSDIRQFDSEASQLPGIIKLTLGEPDFNTPEHIKEAAIKAIQDNKSHYTPNAGIPELRAATAKYFNEKYNLNYQASQVITTIGATEGINASLQALLNPGDTVLVPTPVFPIYMVDTEINGGQFVTLDTSADDFILTPNRLEEAIAAHPTTKVVVFNYPCNPTGVTYSREQLEAIAAVARKHDLWILSDEIYAELTYSGDHISMAEILPEKTVLLSGLSKSHAMTGWRIGFILGPQAFIDQAIKSHQYMVTAPTTNAQYAALEAVSHGQNDAAVMKAEYARRREYLKTALEDAGFTLADPQGAFYLFSKIPDGKLQDWDFVRDLAQKARVAVIPGLSFGPGGEGYIRLSYAASMENIKLAASRIKDYMEGKYFDD